MNISSNLFPDEKVDTIRAIESHPLLSHEGFKKTILRKELDDFIFWRCEKVKPEMAEKLYQRKIYHFVLEILNEIQSLLDKQSQSSIEIIHAYERNYSLLCQLNRISKMRFNVSSTTNKAKGTHKEYEYATMNFYTGFIPTHTHVKRNYRTLGNLSDYQGRNDPQINIDAEKRFFDDCLGEFIELKQMPIEEFLKTIPHSFAHARKDKGKGF